MIVKLVKVLTYYIITVDYCESKCPGFSRIQTVMGDRPAARPLSTSEMGIVPTDDEDEDDGANDSDGDSDNDGDNDNDGDYQDEEQERENTDDQQQDQEYTGNQAITLDDDGDRYVDSATSIELLDSTYTDLLHHQDSFYGSDAFEDSQVAYSMTMTDGSFAGESSGAGSSRDPLTPTFSVPAKRSSTLPSGSKSDKGKDKGKQRHISIGDSDSEVSAKKKKMSVSDAIVESNINAQQTSAELLRLCSETAAIEREERKRAYDQQERQWEWECGYRDRKLHIERMQVQVALIRSLRDMGLSPEEIRGYLDGGDAGHLGL